MVKEIVRELCKERNISITKLEEELGLSNGAIGKWGKVSPKAESLEKVANYFGVSVDYLLGRTQGLSDDEIMALFPGGHFNLQQFGVNAPSPVDQQYIDRALELFSQMDDAHKKAALAQLEALAAINKK